MKGTDGMNRQEFIEAVAASTGETEASTGEAIDAILEAVTSAVTQGNTEQLIGFRSFSPGARAERARTQSLDRRNHHHRGRETDRFTGKGFKDAVNST
jgi:DNA-binding protein HU-beta